MFMVKLVEKATNKLGGNLEGLKAENVNPRLVFHYGMPFEATKLAYDPIQKIVAISTKNGQIKVLGKDNTQALLESNDMQPSKFLEFIYNKGIILNVTSKNRIEVWDIDKNVLAYVHDFEKEIASFTILQQCSFIFIGDFDGNVTIWKLNQEHHIKRMKYWIPCMASYGNEDANGAGIMFCLPQPTAESKRILLIHVDGLLVLWDFRESKSIFTIGGASTQLSPETKEVTYACWVCPFGSKVAVGFNTGDICIYTIPSNVQCGNNSSMSKESSNSQVGHIFKLNLAYRTEKIPIVSLKWVYADGKSSRLYVMGACDATATNVVQQVILLNGDAESRTIKIGLQLPEPCLDMEIVSCFEDHNKHKHGHLLLVGKSGQIYAYDDHEIEKYLLQFQSKCPPSNPSEVMIKLPFSNSSIHSAQFITNNSSIVGSGDRDYISTAKTIPSLIPSESKQSDPSHFTGFAKIKNLYITGHSDGTIKFWDVSCPLVIPLLSITQQSEDDSSQTGKPVTAIYYCTESKHLFSGDKSGTVRIYQFKPEPFSTESSFFSLPGSSKKGSNHVIQSVKFLKVNGSVLSFSLSNSSSHVAVGSENGHVSVIDIEGPSLLYQKQVETELSADIISLQFAACNFHGFEKKILVVAARDSSISAFEADTGNTLNSRVVQPKKPLRASLCRP